MIRNYLARIARKVMRRPAERLRTETIGDGEEFDEFLGALSRAEQEKIRAKKAKIQENHQKWADAFELLKANFGEVWTLFGGVEKKVEGWSRHSCSYKQWDFMGKSGWGYNFGAGIHYQYGRMSVLGCGDEGTKYLSVSFGCYGGMGPDGWRDAVNGIGDERELRGNLDDQLSGSERNLESLSEHDLVFDLYNQSTHLKRRVCGSMEALRENSLRELCERLFIALTHDEVNVDDLQAYLGKHIYPAPGAAESLPGPAQLLLPGPS